MDAWADAITSWLAVLRAAGRPNTTLGLRDYQLRRLATAMAQLDLGPWDVTGEHLVEWFGSHDWSRSTLRSFRSAARSFYRLAHARGRVAVDPALELPMVKPVPPRPHPTPEDAYRLALAKAADRERLMLRLAAELGMRRGEVARAHRNDLRRDLFGWSLYVHGKGARERIVPVPDGLAQVIRRHEGYLFPSVRTGSHLSPAYVGKLVSRLLPEAWAMHSLRHRFATAAHNFNHDLVVVQQLLGHASIATTQAYVLAEREELRRTVAAVGAL